MALKSCFLPTKTKTIVLFQFSVMEHPVQLSWILLMLMTICVTEGTFVQKLYRKLEPGQNIAGIVIAEKEAVSPIDCSRM